MNKDVRWKQRFQNLEKAYALLEKGLAIITPNETEQQGIIQSFEFTFELSWKTLKDYLESKGVQVSFPRDVIKEAFHNNILPDAEVWLDMLSKRNFLAHTYDEKHAKKALSLIRTNYQPSIKKLVDFFTKENN